MTAYRQLTKEEALQAVHDRTMMNFLGAAEVLFRDATGGADSFDFYMAAITMMVDRLGVMCDGEKPMQDFLRAMSDQLCSYDTQKFKASQKREEEARLQLRQCFNRMHGAGATPGVKQRWKPPQ